MRPFVLRHRFALATLALVLFQATFQAFVLSRELGGFHNVEEGFSVYVARECLAGFRSPWTVHAYSPYEGGTLVFGLLCVPAVWACGPTLLAGKLVALAWSAATLAAAIAAGARLFGRRTGLVAGVLLACGPPGWVVRGTQAVGDTHKSLLFVLAACCAWAYLQRPGRSTWAETRGALVLGAVCGLGIAFSLAVLPAAALVLAGLVATRGRGAARLAAIALVATAVGMAIPLWNWAVHGIKFYEWRGGSLVGMVDAGGSPLAALAEIGAERIATPLRFGLNVEPLGADIQLALHRAYWLAVAAASLVTGAIGAARGRAGAAELLVFALGAANLAAYLATPHRAFYWLLLLVPTGALCVARALGALARAGRAGLPLAGTLFAAILAIELAPWSGLEARDPDGPVPGAVQGDPERWRWRVPSKRLEVFQHYELHDIFPIADEEAWGAGHLFALQGDGAVAASRLIGAQSRPVAARLANGFGYGQCWVEASIERLAQTLELHPAHVVPDALHGFGHALGEERCVDPSPLVEELPRPLTAPEATSFWRGYGHGVGLYYWHGPSKIDLSAVPGEHWGDVRTGLLDRLIADYPRTARARGAILPEVVAEPPAAKAGVGPVAIEAHAFHEGNVAELEVDGVAVVTDGDAYPARAKYRFAVAVRGGYGLWIRFASREPRPVVATVGRRVPLTGGGTTGSDERFGWVRLGHLELETGPLELVLEARRRFPHLAGIRLLFGDP